MEKNQGLEKPCGVSQYNEVCPEPPAHTVPPWLSFGLRGHHLKPLGLPSRTGLGDGTLSHISIPELSPYTWEAHMCGPRPYSISQGRICDAVPQSSESL